MQAPTKIKSILCWWFGCKPNPDDLAQPEYVKCVRCGEFVLYEHLCGLTRHQAFCGWANYWLFRKWWPEKCEHGRRFGCRDEHLPF